MRAVQYTAPVQDAPFAGGPVYDPPTPLEVCLLEVFRSTGTVDLSLNSPRYSLYELNREVRVLDLADSDWVTDAGGNAAISSGAHGQARSWSRAIYRRYQVGDTGSLDGLRYQCSNLPRGRSLVLFETGGSALPATPLLSVPLAHSSLRGDIQTFCYRVKLNLVGT